MAAATKTTVSPGTAKIAFSNTPQAKDDRFDFTQDDSGLLTCDVLSNDGGGKAATLWSLDDGDNATDLLAARTSSLSACGAHIEIKDGVVLYDVSHWGDLSHLARGGEPITDTFTYAIRLGNGTISWATATVVITGENDAPVTGGAFTAEVNEDSTVSGAVTATDADDGAKLTFTADAAAGLAFNADGTWSFNASDAAYQHLAAGVTQDVVVTYTVTDEWGAQARDTLTITVTGVNDQASMDADSSFDVKEDSAAQSASGTIGAVQDDDDGENTFGTVEETHVYGTWSFDADTGAWTYTLSNDAAAVQALNTGNIEADTLTIWSKDGTAHTTITANVHGTDEPVNINLTHVPEGEPIRGTPGTPDQTVTDDFTTSPPPLSGPSNLQGLWTNWLSALSDWRAKEQALHGRDTDPTETSVVYTHGSSSNPQYKTASYDITYSYVVAGTPGTPDIPGTAAYLQLGNDAFVKFNADTQLVFHMDGGVTLAQLQAMTTVDLVNIDDDGALDTVILFGDGKTLTLFNAGVDNLNAIADHIQIA